MDEEGTRPGKRPVGIAALLAHLPLFSGLGPEELVRIAAGARQVHAGKGDVLVAKGERCEGFHLIINGRVKLVFTTAEGVEQVVAILGQGQAFGESQMLLGLPSEVSALALSDSLLLHVSKAALFQEFDRDPALRLKMLAGMSRRLRELMDEVESFSLHSARRRVTDYLLRLLPERPAAVEAVLALPASKATIASRLNITQAHFSRILRELSNDGLIEVQGRKILVPDLRRLREASA